MTAAAANLPDDDDLLPSSIVKKENGDISDMTLWRWTRDPIIQFPQPDLVINNRKYWKRGTLRRHRQRIENLPKEMPKVTQLSR
jgi:hypothetical protein